MVAINLVSLSDKKEREEVCLLKTLLLYSFLRKNDIHFELYSIFYYQLLYGNQFQFHSTTYLQAGRTTYGMWTNTIEKGRTTIGFDELTCTGSKLGMFPDESTLKMFSLSSMVLLCRLPSFAVRWYSSLAGSLLVARGSLVVFALWTVLVLWEALDWWRLLCFRSRLHVPLNATLARTVVLLSRLLSSTVIPFCMMKMYKLTKWRWIPFTNKWKYGLNLQIVLHNEHKHVFFLSRQSLSITRFFPLIGAKEEHCQERNPGSKHCY